ncbi:MAG: zinc-dependent metalloprotease [Thermoguttaceae bacterium]|nr:zinc-dependent metalloprotease [Thermoguttaceae bacterium]
MKRQHLFYALLALSALGVSVFADDQTTPVPDTGEVAVEAAELASNASPNAAPVPFAQAVPEAERIGGPIKTYRKKDALYWEIGSEQYGSDYIIIMSLARGVGTSDLYGGQSLDYGDDMIWRFVKVDDRVQIVRRNYRYKSDSGPDAEALRVAFTDSIIFSLPIIATGPNGGDIVNVSGLFMSDQLCRLGIGSFASDRSTWAKVKAMKDNLELEVAATYSAGSGSTETIIDTRGVCVNVHYSISKLKNTGYQPRYADERVGYFMTALRDVSKTSSDDNFIRYINRWNLQKLEPSAEKSLPKKPIVFWLDKATPYQYRKMLRDGILEWNKAFEKAGFYNAVEVRQQEDNDDWDAEDINYNTIRWSVTPTGFAIGPSRVNPTTGEILDADVVLTVGFLSSWARQFELYTSDQLIDKFANFNRENALKELENGSDNLRRRFNENDTELYYSQQFGLANTFFDVMAVDDAMFESFFGESKTDDWTPADVAQQDETAPAEDAAKKAEEEAAAKAREEARLAEEQALRDTAQKASEAAAAAQKTADEAKVAADEAKAANAANAEELGKKAQEAKEAADVALRVATETAKKLDELRAAFDELKQAEEAKKAEEAKLAEEAKQKAEEEAKKTAEAKEKEEKEKKIAENKKRLEKEKEKLVEQGLRQLVTHEVGHTLGLRHSFQQSALHSLDEINDASKWTEHGFVGSIMEYAPINIMPKGRQQGDYYSYRLGEYDEWVIEYGYKVFNGKSTDSELPELKKIAALQSKPEYTYSTDEDCYGSTVNPYVNIWDLGSSPLEYAKVRTALVDQLMPNLNDEIVKDGESYQRLQTRFNMLNSWKAGAMTFAANYIGGMQVHRDFKGDEGERKPFEVVPAKDQRDAMAFLKENVFSKDSYKVPPQLFNYLAPNRWYHWGSSIRDRYDSDVHATILGWQSSVLAQLLSNLTLSHLADAEIRVPEGEDVFTSAEMLDTLSDAIFQEIFDAAKAIDENKDAKASVVISTQRRNLQRYYFSRLCSFATNSSTAAGVADVAALSRMQLRKLQKAIQTVLATEADYASANNRGQDRFARSHLESLNEQIDRTLNAVQTIGGGSSGGGIILL